MEDSVLPVELPIVEIRLNRMKGLGFNITGGIDMPLIKGEPGIYVSKVKPDGAAFRDGRIKEGDRIVSVNQTDLEGVTHMIAVKAFLNAEDDVVVLRVQHGAKRYIIDNRRNIERYTVPSPRPLVKSKSRKRGFDYGTFIVFLTGVSIVGYLIFKYKPCGGFQ